ncbi:hypothetical protein WEI85_23060 [Actinomycetes bacterium KLBMP 9797]
MESGGHVPPGSAAMIPGVRALVETVLLSARGGQLCFRTARRPLGIGEHPDACARSLAGLTEGALLHSSSWRYAEGGIVLTYVALPDPDGAAAVLPVPDLPPVRGSDPLTPSPPVVRPVDVAVHACRHLAFLRHTDPTVAANAATELWDLIDVFTPAVAGLLTRAG